MDCSGWGVHSFGKYVIFEGRLLIGQLIFLFCWKFLSRGVHQPTAYGIV